MKDNRIEQIKKWHEYHGLCIDALLKSFITLDEFNLHEGEFDRFFDTLYPQEPQPETPDELESTQSEIKQDREDNYTLDQFINDRQAHASEGMLLSKKYRKTIDAIDTDICKSIRAEVLKEINAWGNELCIDRHRVAGYNSDGSPTLVKGLGHPPKRYCDICWQEKFIPQLKRKAENDE